MKKMNKAYWEGRYALKSMGWDAGGITTPLKTYIDQLDNKALKILVPGAGYGYEVAYLYRQGFHNVYALDIALQPLQHLRNELPEFPEKQVLQGDFFELQHGGFDLILEQTFFCALLPGQRRAYAEKMYGLLSPKGKLAGLFFDFPRTEKGPPFGGSKKEYEALFSPLFTIRVLERAYNSIPPRFGTELFFIFTR